MSETAEEVRSYPWHTIEALKGTQLGALVADLKEAQRLTEDAETREEKIRVMIGEILAPLKLEHSVEALDLSLRWNPAGKPGEKLDRTLLARAGVTPEQILAGMRPTKPREAHLTVRSLLRSEGDSSERLEGG